MQTLTPNTIGIELRFQIHLNNQGVTINVPDIAIP